MKTTKRWLVLLLAGLLIIPNAAVAKAEELTDGAAAESFERETDGAAAENSEEEAFFNNEMQEIGMIDDGEDADDISEEMAAELLSNDDIETDLEEEPEQIGASSGSCGANLAWSVEGGTLTISGTGKMFDYEMSSVPWIHSYNEIEAIVIQKGVTSIGNNAFYYCKKASSVSIPDSINSIGEWAFANCDSLTNISIPENVKEVGQYSFSYCDKLTTVSIPSSVKIIPDGMFYECFELKNVRVPETLIKIGAFAFNGCKSLASFTIPAQVTEIGYMAFRNCTNLTSMVIPKGVETVRCFEGCSKLSSVTIPDTVTYIDGFKDCVSLKTITLSDSVDIIAESAFEGCTSLTSIVIPKKIYILRKNVFRGCSSLQSVTMKEGKEYYGTHYYQRGVEEIEEGAFEGCSSLKSITLPSTLVLIGDNAFRDCSSLKEITFLGNAPGQLGKSIFTNVTAKVYYDQYSKGWTANVKQYLGGNLTWIKKDSGLRSAEITGLYNSSFGADIRWKAVDRAEEYVIYRTNGGKTEKVITLPKQVTDFVDQSVRNSWGRVYVYYVCVKVGDVETPRQNGQTLQRLAPMEISYLQIDSKNIAHIAWGSTEGSNKANGYEIQYAESSADLYGRKGTFKKITVNGRNNLSRTIGGLKKGQKYWFRVRAYVNYTHSVTKKVTKTWSQYSGVWRAQGCL